MHTPQDICGSQKTTFRSQFSPSTVWSVLTFYSSGYLVTNTYLLRHPASHETISVRNKVVNVIVTDFKTYSKNIMIEPIRNKHQGHSFRAI